MLATTMTLGHAGFRTEVEYIQPAACVMTFSTTAPMAYVDG